MITQHYTVAEVAERLGVSQKTVRNLLSVRALEYVKIGATTRIPEYAIQKYLEKQSVRAVS